MSEVIRLENAVKMYDNGIRAVNDISLSISEGECVVISGPSGSGKTTLARLIAGMETPSSGEVIVLDRPVHQMTPDAAAVFRNINIGILRKDPEFLDTLTVLENVAMPLALRGAAAAQRIREAKEQLKTLDLGL
jgi:ABC-type lipoprotein export system ATPase subunit